MHGESFARLFGEGIIGGIMKIIQAGFFVVVAIFMSQKSLAWGAFGHQATALVAEAYLNQATKEKINSLLNGRRIADIANDADRLRDLPEFAGTKGYHFQNIDFYATDLKTSYRKQIEKDVLNGRNAYRPGVVEAIMKAQQDLVDSNSNEQQKRMALKFLVHFVGDLHQPLHTGLKRQRGGNGEYLIWDHQSQNLHQVWDSALIQDDAEALTGSFRAPIWTYAKKLISNHSNGPQSKIMSNDFGTPEDWFSESLEIQQKAMKDIRRISPQEYKKWAQQIVEERIYWGGRRLADVLNKSLVSVQTSTVRSLNFKNWLDSHLGDLSLLINFEAQSN